MSETGGAGPDRIEVSVALTAGLGRVWRALADSGEFGRWFMADLDGPFVAGEKVRGHVTVPGYEHVGLEMQVVEVVPGALFAFRWHPYAVNPDIDYSQEPTTLVEFRLEEAGHGTLVTITETGFDQVPARRRAEAYEMHQGGWAEQVVNLARYTAAPAHG